MTAEAAGIGIFFGVCIYLAHKLSTKRGYKEGYISAAAWGVGIFTLSFMIAIVIGLMIRMTPEEMGSFSWAVAGPVSMATLILLSIKKIV